VAVIIRRVFFSFLKTPWVTELSPEPVGPEMIMIFHFFLLISFLECFLVLLVIRV